MRIELLLLLTLFFCGSAIAQNNGDPLLPAKLESSWGFIDLQGNWKIAPKYDNCLPFDDRKLTWVQSGNSSLLINRQGKEVLSLAAKNIIELHDDLIFFESDHRLGIINFKGETLAQPRYRSLNYIDERRHIIASDSFSTSVLNAQAQALTKFPCINIKENLLGYTVQTQTGFGVIDTLGDLIVDTSLAYIDVGEEFIYGMDSLNITYVYNSHGLELVRGNFSTVDMLPHEHVSYMKGDKTYLMNYNTGEILDSIHTAYQLLASEYLVTTAITGMSGIYSLKDDRQILQDSFEYIDHISSTTLCVMFKEGKYGLASLTDEKMITPLKYDFIGEVEEDGLMRMIIDRKLGILTPQGAEFTEAKYDRLKFGNDQTIKAYKDTDIDLIEYDPNTYEITASLSFSNVVKIDMGGANLVVTMNAAGGQNNLSKYWFQDQKNKWGLMDSTGNIVVPAHFDQVFKIAGTNFVLGKVRNPGIIYRFRRFRVQKEFTYGLVDESKFKQYGTSSFWYIDTSNIRDPRTNVIRAIGNGGIALTINKFSGKHLYYSSKYIGEFHCGYARLYYSPNIKITRETHPSENEIISLWSYMNEYHFNYVPSGLNTRVGEYELNAKGFWVYIDSNGRYVSSIEFFKKLDLSYAGDFVNNRVIIGTKGLYGMLNSSFHTVLPPSYSKIEFVPQSNDSLIITHSASINYGFVSATGTQLAPTVFDKYISFNDGYGWGFNGYRGYTLINKQGETKKFTTNLSSVDMIHEGVAAASIGYKKLVVDINENYISNPIYSRVGESSEGLVPVKYKGYYGYIDHDGKGIIPYVYSKAEPFSEGLALVKEGLKPKSDPTKKKRINNPKYGFIDTKGEFVVKPKLNKAWSFSENKVAKVRSARGYGYLNEKGHWAVNPVYKKVFESPTILVASNISKTKIFNHEGKKIYSFFGTIKGEIIDGHFLARQKRLYGIMNSSGDWVIKPIHKSLSSMSEGVCYSQNKDRCFIISETGDTLASVKGRAIGLMSDGLILIQRYSAYFYVNKFGKNVFNMNFAHAEPMTNGMAIVREDQFRGVINSKGFYVVKPIFYNIHQASDGVYPVLVSNQKGVCDLNGTYLISPKCNEITYLSEYGIFRYQQNNAYGYFNFNGSMIYRIDDYD